MNRISYLNGKFLPHEDCKISIEDRSVQFGDGVYEVILFKNNKLIDDVFHIERLFRSLNEVKIEHNFNQDFFQNLAKTLFEKNNLNEGSIYLQISRGVMNRIQNCPTGFEPTIISTVSPLKKFTQEEFEEGISVITSDDIRWSRVDIKSLNLLPAVLTNQKAKDLNFNDAIFVRDNFVTEGTFANVFIVDKNNKLITRNADNFILCGITRNRIIELAKKRGLEVEERKFNVEELKKAKEVFLTSSTLIVRAVVKVDEIVIGSKAGEISKLLRNDYLDFIEE